MVFVNLRKKKKTRGKFQFVEEADLILLKGKGENQVRHTKLNFVLSNPSSKLYIFFFLQVTKEECLSLSHTIEVVAKNKIQYKREIKERQLKRYDKSDFVLSSSTMDMRLV